MSSTTCRRASVFTPALAGGRRRTTAAGIVGLSRAHHGSAGAPMEGMTTDEYALHIALAAQAVDDLVAGLRWREIEFDALAQAAREEAPSAVWLDQADDAAMRMQGPRRQVEQVDFHLRHAATSAQGKSSPAAEAADDALAFLDQVRRHVHRAQELLREAVAGDSHSSTTASRGVQAAQQAAAHAQAGRKVTDQVGEMTSLMRTIRHGAGAIQGPEVW